MYNSLFNHLRDRAETIIGNGGFPTDEFNAVITHYLQSGGQIRVFGNKGFWLRARKQIAEFCNLKDSGIETVNQYLAGIPVNHINYPPPENPEFKFIDLFAGIGGFRIAFQNLGGQCVFSCEWDRFAKETYFRNFGEYPFGDVNQFTDPRRISDEELNRLIPDHDVLAAGFPCQPFSLAGVSKKQSLGREHGFNDPTQGTLFFDIKRILMVKRPRAFLLENVKNLLSHDRGQTWDEIWRSLTIDLGYTVNFAVVDGKNWVPQHRERVYIVGYNPQHISIEAEEIAIPDQPQNGFRRVELRDIIQPQVPKKYTLGPGTWATLLRHKDKHEAAGNGFG